jgi:hypothetical protein
MPRRKATSTAARAESVPMLATSRGPSLNRAAIIGRLTRSPQLRQTKSGRAVSTMRVATNDGAEPTSNG